MKLRRTVKAYEVEPYQAGNVWRLRRYMTKSDITESILYVAKNFFLMNQEKYEEGYVKFYLNTPPLEFESREEAAPYARLLSIFMEGNEPANRKKKLLDTF